MHLKIYFFLKQQFKRIFSSLWYRDEGLMLSLSMMRQL